FKAGHHRNDKEAVTNLDEDAYSQHPPASPRPKPLVFSEALNQFHLLGCELHHLLRLLVEPKIRHVVVLHDVDLEFETLFARAFGLRLAARLREVGKADDLGADETLLNVSMDRAGGFPRGEAGADGPR